MQQQNTVNRIIDSPFIIFNSEINYGRLLHPSTATAVIELIQQIDTNSGRPGKNVNYQNGCSFDL